MRWLALISLFLIAGCNATVRSDVTSFSQPQSLQQGQSFYVDPKAGQAGGIEFSRYREFLSAALIQNGYQPASSKKSADILVGMNYGVDEEIVDSLSPSVYGTVGIGGGVSSAGVGLGTVIGSHRPGRDRYHDYAVFKRHLEVTMKKNGGGQNIFEGRAISKGRTSALPEVMPCLVKSLFQDFPNGNGQTKKVSLSKNECVF